ncbi:hypothetical protein [Vibrio sp. SCSIO 43137]|uniref:hypothetical protein n=1 Tax=Vibrio sp. SCSIO 43137 TaxID=3021011 RepID=UPI002306F4C6|nr:hypothetical protein [Vibrio sp. SCSIO 43137]WCE30097.1 hypothetical protein PK654_02025 [Vibrio sp. SCSIO 43137]
MARPFFKDVYDSGLCEIWFKLITNSAITSASVVFANKIGGQLGWGLFVICYLFLATQMAHGTRAPYEYLKAIYVTPNSNSLLSQLFYAGILFIRLHVMLIPIWIVWMSLANGNSVF